MTDSRATRASRPGPLRACCCSGCGLAVVVLVVVAYLALTPPRPPAPLSPADAAKLDAAVAAKRADLEKLSRDSAAHKKQPFTLTLREAEVNRLLETDERLLAAMKREQIERAWVTMGDGRVDATVIRDGTPPSLTVAVAPEIDDRGRLKLTIQSMNIGRLGMPGVDAVQRAAQKAVARLMEESMIPKARFDKIQVQEGSILLSGHTP